MGNIRHCRRNKSSATLYLELGDWEGPCLPSKVLTWPSLMTMSGVQAYIIMKAAAGSRPLHAK